MCSILQGIRVQVQVLKPCKSIQELSEEVLFIKARQMYLSRFNSWDSTDSSTAISIENYEIQISRYVFHAYPSYLCKFSFLTILDIYQDSFLTILDIMQSDYSLKLWPETICPNSSFFGRIYCVFAPRVL